MKSLIKEFAESFTRFKLTIRGLKDASDLPFTLVERIRFELKVRLGSELLHLSPSLFRIAKLFYLTVLF